METEWVYCVGSEKIFLVARLRVDCWLVETGIQYRHWPFVNRYFFGVGSFSYYLFPSYLITLSVPFPFITQSQLWVGVLLSTQSFFVGGLDDPEAAKTSAFGAMGMFIVTFFASIFGIYYDSGRKAESIEETPEGYGQLNVPGSATDYGAM